MSKEKRIRRKQEVELHRKIDQIQMKLKNAVNDLARNHYSKQLAEIREKLQHG